MGRPPPERDARGLSTKARAALGTLDRHLGAGLRHRRVRRLVCGPYADLTGAYRFAEATMVLADRPGRGPTILDLACRTLDAGGPTHRTPMALAEVVAAPDSASVVAAVDRGMHCLEDGGGGCLDAVAPFGRLLHAWLARALDADRADREAALKRVRGLVTGGSDARAGFLLDQLQLRCGDVGRLIGGPCRAGAPRPSPGRHPCPGASAPRRPPGSGPSRRSPAPGRPRGPSRSVASPAATSGPR